MAIANLNLISGTVFTNRFASASDIIVKEAEVLVSGAGQTTKRMRLSTNSKPVNSSTLVVTHKSDSEGEKTRQAVVIHTEPVIHHEVAQVAQEISDGSSMQDGQMVTPTVVATSPTSSLCTTPPIANVPVCIYSLIFLILMFYFAVTFISKKKGRSVVIFFALFSFLKETFYSFLMFS